MNSMLTSVIDNFCKNLFRRSRNLPEKNSHLLDKLRVNVMTLKFCIFTASEKAFKQKLITLILNDDDDGDRTSPKSCYRKKISPI